MAEFNERQAEMHREIVGAYGLSKDNHQVEQMTRAGGDQVSKAGSSVSKPVLQSNMEQLYDFRSKLGMIKKNRPTSEDQTTQQIVDSASVQTPRHEADD